MGLEQWHPDAIVCSNDIAALKLSKTFAKLNVRIPEDVMLAGFDDLVEAGRMKPALISVSQPCFLHVSGFCRPVKHCGNILL